jgi:TRAP-type C4-dicarboxylate transport system permease small subunit
LRASNEEAAMRLIVWLGLLGAAFITQAAAQVDPA